jgi:DNA-binding XRE family transcriptional regulator
MPSLREVRAARGLTGGRLAWLAHLSAETVYGIEQGRCRPSYRTVQRLAAVLQIEPETVDEFRDVVEKHYVPTGHLPGRPG